MSFGDKGKATKSEEEQDRDPKRQTNMVVDDVVTWKSGEGTEGELVQDNQEVYNK